MTTDEKKVDETKDDPKSTLETEGIIVENTDSIQKNLKEDMSALQTEEAEKELFDAIGVEIPKTVTEPKKPESDKLKEELNKKGIELLPTEPLKDDEL